MAGLACARELHRLGVAALLVERSTQLGGRVATDVVDGFLLDRGFQVLITSYPQAALEFSDPALGLAPFDAGAIVHARDKLEFLYNPFRAPNRIIATLFTSVMTLGDKARLGWLLADVMLRPSTPGSQALSGQTTLEYLQDTGFSPRSIAEFFRPFFGGVFLDDSLSAPAVKFRYLLRLFAVGRAALPRGGIGALAYHLARDLSHTVVRCGMDVVGISPPSPDTSTNAIIHVEGGETLSAKAVVLTSSALEKAFVPPSLQLPAPPYHSVAHAYFVIDRSRPHPLLTQRSLVLMGDTPSNKPEEGASACRVLHIAPLSAVQPSYAPAGSTLFSVTALVDPAYDVSSLEHDCRRTLIQCITPDIQTWRCITTEIIKQALPAGFPNHATTIEAPWLYRCGDYVREATLNGAITSGKEVAHAIASTFP